MPECHGIEYHLIAPRTPDGNWRWTVHLDRATILSGETLMKHSAIQSVRRAIKRALELREQTGQLRKESPPG